MLRYLFVFFVKKKKMHRHQRSLEAYAPRFRTDERRNGRRARVPDAYTAVGGVCANRNRRTAIARYAPLSYRYYRNIGIIAKRLGGAERLSSITKKKTWYNYTEKNDIIAETW